jgi:RimJ/RimL family protein N-acetyltransferase
MKKKHKGHYCKICSEYKANEKFSGKGHAIHICKACSKLSVKQRKELQRADIITEADFNLPVSDDEPDYDLFGNYIYPEIAGFAGLECEDKGTVSEDIYDALNEFICMRGYIPEKKHKHKMIDSVFSEIYLEDGKQLVPDESLHTRFDEILQKVIGDLRQDGIEPESYRETLVVFETGRLTVRKFIPDDLPALFGIMGKEEVMYAWEQGFSKNEMRKWLNRQLTRYKKDGYGYYAVLLKGKDTLIGQAGLLKSEIDGKEVIELGYIFDNLYWKQGYCTEAIKACIRFASDKLKIKELYATIRPENKDSIRIAEKMGMVKVGEQIKIYREKEMLHWVYRLHL